MEPQKRVVLPTTSQSSTNTWTIFRHEAGYRLDGVHSQHTITVSGALDDGTKDGRWSVEVTASGESEQTTYSRAAANLLAGALVDLPENLAIDGIKVTIQAGTNMPAGQQFVLLSSRARGL